MESDCALQVDIDNDIDKGVLLFQKGSILKVSYYPKLVFVKQKVDNKLQLFCPVEKDSLMDCHGAGNCFVCIIGKKMLHVYQ